VRVRIQIKRISKWAGLGLLSLLLLGVFVEFALGWLQRWRAEKLLVLARQTQVGTETEGEFESSAAHVLRFTGLSGNIYTDLWEPSIKKVSYEVFNDVAPLNLLTSQTMFTLNVRFKNGQVLDRSAVLYSENYPSVQAESVEYIRESPYGPGTGDAPADYPHRFVKLDKSRESTYTPRQVLSVADDNEATKEELKADWNFNLACLTRFRGCHDARELLPDAKLTKPYQGRW
jgi:hypothetical protein